MNINKHTLPVQARVSGIFEKTEINGQGRLSEEEFMASIMREKNAQPRREEHFCSVSDDFFLSQAQAC